MGDANDLEPPAPTPSSPDDASCTVVVFAGGDRVPGDLRRLVPPGAAVIAADSGLHVAQAIGVGVDLVIGDFDSVADEALRAAVSGGATTERFPAAKDQTDLELALHRAVELGADRIVVIGGHGGRADHFLANALLLAADLAREVPVEAHFGPARVHVVRSECVIDAHVGDLLTLLPVHGPAHGVTTNGLRYPLRAETLHPGSTRGVSNQFVAPRASVRLETGVLLAIAPGEGNRP